MIIKGENIEIPEVSRVKVKKMNHIVEVTYIEKKNQELLRYKKISKDEMVDKTTGEIIQVEHKEDRKGNISSLRRTISNLRDIINTNFVGGENELFITLTYAENMKDTERLYKDFDKFYKKLKRRLRGHELLYISVVEPQERGAWHVHLLLKDLTCESLYIHNEEIEKMWGQGFTKTERLHHVDNVGAYLSAYLTNIKEGEETKKGQRLYLYPPGMNIYRCSRNVKRPIIVEKEYKQVKEKLEKYKTYESTYIVIDIDENINGVRQLKQLNCIKKEYYNTRRL